MPLPKLQEQRELEAIAARIRHQIDQKQRELAALEETLQAVTDAAAVVSDASRKYYGRHPID